MGQQRGVGFSSELPRTDDGVFGRSSDADVTIDDESTSWRHAAMRGNAIRRQARPTGRAAHGEAETSDL